MLVANSAADRRRYVASAPRRHRAGAGAQLGPMTVHLWINDGLMAVFFLLVGLEIKRELVDGRLASRRAAAPAGDRRGGGDGGAGAGLSRGHRRRRRGWRAAGRSRRRPTSPLRSACWRCSAPRVPPSLKLFLTTVAIVDDMGAVAIIALAYTDELDSSRWRGAAAVAAGACTALNRRGVRAAVAVSGSARAAVVAGAAVGRPRDRRRACSRRC